MGLLSGLQDMLQKANTGTAEKPSFVDRLNAFGASLQDISDGGDRAVQLRNAQQQELERQQALAQRQQLAKMADDLGLSPKEKLLFMVNPQAFGNLLRDQAQPYTLSEGQTRYGPNNQVAASAPKTLTFGDQLLSVGPEGVQNLFSRPKTYEELLREELGRGNLEVSRGQLGVARQNAATSAGQLGVARGRLGLSQKEYEARLKGIGGFGTPGVGNVLGATLDDDWEVQP